MKRRYQVVERNGELCATVPLFRRNNDVVGHALVSLTDLAWVSAHRWRLHGEGYAVRQDGEREQLMHREALGLTVGDERHADHINRDRLDNRSVNLRAVLPCHNAQNRRVRPHSSRHRGVDWHEARGRWRARGKLNGVQHHLGYFDDEDQAGRVAAEWRAEHLPYSADASGHRKDSAGLSKHRATLEDTEPAPHPGGAGIAASGAVLRTEEHQCGTEDRVELANGRQVHG